MGWGVSEYVCVNVVCTRYLTYLLSSSSHHFHFISIMYATRRSLLSRHASALAGPIRKIAAGASSKDQNRLTPKSKIPIQIRRPSPRPPDAPDISAFTNQATTPENLTHCINVVPPNVTFNLDGIGRVGYSIETPGMAYVRRKMD